MTTFTLGLHDGRRARALLDELADAYLVGYADDPEVGHSIYAREEFLRRTGRQAESPGFVLVTARDGAGTLQGFSFGLPFGAGRWWRGRQETPPPDELVRAEKFAVIELVVLPQARGQRLATRLINAVLAERPEPWAMLLADRSGHARSIYDGWGGGRSAPCGPGRTWHRWTSLCIRCISVSTGTREPASLALDQRAAVVDDIGGHLAGQGREVDRLRSDGMRLPQPFQRGGPVLS